MACSLILRCQSISNRVGVWGSGRHRNLKDPVARPRAQKTRFGPCDRHRMAEHGLASRTGFSPCSMRRSSLSLGLRKPSCPLLLQSAVATRPPPYSGACSPGRPRACSASMASEAAVDGVGGAAAEVAAATALDEAPFDSDSVGGASQEVEHQDDSDNMQRVRNPFEDEDGTVVYGRLVVLGYKVRTRGGPGKPQRKARKVPQKFHRKDALSATWDAAAAQEYLVRDSVWNPMGRCNEIFDLRRREAPNGIARATSYFIHTEDPGTRLRSPALRHPEATHSVTMNVDLPEDDESDSTGELLGSDVAEISQHLQSLDTNEAEAPRDRIRRPKDDVKAPLKSRPNLSQMPSMGAETCVESSYSPSAEVVPDVATGCPTMDSRAPTHLRVEYVPDHGTDMFQVGVKRGKANDAKDLCFVQRTRKQQNSTCLPHGKIRKRWNKETHEMCTKTFP
eukprot:scaffold5260_cov242-Pinguiococcus_pyrenoidosus.AAC.4